MQREDYFSTHISLEAIHLDSHGLHLLAPCTIHNNADSHSAYCIIDTGASVSVFDDSLLHTDNYTHIDSELVEASQLTHTSQGQLINIKSLMIDTSMFYDIIALAMNLDHINTIYKNFIHAPIIGLIGGNFLQQYNASIHYNSLQLQVHRDN